MTPCVVAAAILLVPGWAAAQESAASVPVGHVTRTFQPESDTFFTIPIPREAVYTGSIQTVVGNGIQLVEMNFAEGELVYAAGVQSNTYYLHIVSGAAVGHYGTITANDAEWVSTDLDADILEDLQPGDRAIIRPYWTLGTLFPTELAGSAFLTSGNNLPSQRGSEILLPNITGFGVNRALNQIYFHNGFWRLVGDVGRNQDDTILLPDSYLVFRSRSNSALARSFAGEVDPSLLNVQILALENNQHDNLIGISSASSIALADLNLVQAGSFMESTSNFPGGRGDELLVYEPRSGYNLAPNIIYFYNDFWRQVGNVGDNQNATLLPENAVILIRKRSAGSFTATDWKLNPTPGL